MPPRASVVIATYNWSSVLPYSIGSVLRQTMTDFEVLVVGDACTDDSEDVVTRIGDPRVRWINLPVNTQHQSGPNNEGLREARGEFIAYLGHDDLWLPHHLASLIGTLEASGADMASSLMACVGAEHKGIRPLVPRPRYGAGGPPSSTVHRRTVTDRIGGWRHYRELNIQPEVDLWRRARAAGFRFEFVPRLTGIKFPAAERRNVYKIKPCHEQAAWLARIDSEKDLEIEQLARMIADSKDTDYLSYRDLVREFLSQSIIRAGRRLKDTSAYGGMFWRLKGSGLDEVRRFKGL